MKVEPLLALQWLDVQSQFIDGQQKSLEHGLVKELIMLSVVGLQLFSLKLQHFSVYSSCVKWAQI